MERLYIVMPAYNEAANIEIVVKEWMAIVAKIEGIDAKIVIADSGSTDQTHDILLQLQEKIPQLEILTDTDKQHGPKVIALYRYAIEQGADYIFQTDSDGQTNPSEFVKFWSMRCKYDAILGKRLVRGDGIFRKLVENILRCILYLYFGVKVPDANAPFRLMKREVVARHIDKLEPLYNLPNVMMTTFFVYYQENCKFVEISFQARQGGKNSINIVKILKIGIKALFDFSVFRKEMRLSGRR